MKDKFTHAVDKISSHLLAISDDEFDKIINEHRDGKYANILKEMSFCFIEDSYEVTVNKYISLEITEATFQLSFDFLYKNSSQTVAQISLDYNAVRDNSWMPLAA